MIDLVLVGAAGRMGQAIDSAVAQGSEFRIKARVDRQPGMAAVHSGSTTGGSGYPGYRADLEGGPNPVIGEDRLLEVVAAGDIVVEFSSAEGCRAAARACAERGAALVSGTTGLAAADETELAVAARRVAVLRSANFSLGILALRKAVAAALHALPSAWDVEIIERHHRGKADSPSGTALHIAREVAGGRGLGPAAVRSGREGRLGPRPGDEIGVHAVRGGTWVGDHAVLLAGEGESLELRHVAESRAAFAHGALAAARFVAGAPPGLYTLDDVVAGTGGMKI